MARVVKTVSEPQIFLNIVTTFEDGTQSVKKISKGDVVENLRYVQDEEVKVVSGIVTDIVCDIAKGNTSVANPTDTFSSDIAVKELVIDASEQYHSSIVTVPSMEVVEDEGVENVESVHCYSKLKVDLSITYTDGKTTVDDLEVGDILDNVRLMTSPGKTDIIDRFTIASFLYTASNKKLTVTGMNLVREDGTNVKVDFKQIIRLKEIPQVEVSGDFTDIAAALNDDTVYEVEAKLSEDIDIPLTEDNKIKAVYIPEGKTLHVDLNGHKLSTVAYAFMCTGGTLVLEGEGTITTSHHSTYSAVQVQGGTCILDGPTIDTRTPDDNETPNWCYGITATKDGVVKVLSGEIHTDGASALSICNGTAEGDGAVFEVSGDAKLISDRCAAVYMADNKIFRLSGNAQAIGGICARMGEIEILDNAKVYNDASEDPDYVDPLGKFITASGVSAEPPAILGMTGVYQSVGTENNDLNIYVGPDATVESTKGEAIGIAKIQTKFDQNVRVTIDNLESLIPADGFEKIHVYEFEELQALAAEQGRTITKVSNVDLKITAGNAVIYPVPEVEPEEEPVEP